MNNTNVKKAITVHRLGVAALLKAIGAQTCETRDRSSETSSIEAKRDPDDNGAPNSASILTSSKGYLTHVNPQRNNVLYFPPVGSVGVKNGDGCKFVSKHMKRKDAKFDPMPIRWVFGLKSEHDLEAADGSQKIALSTIAEEMIANACKAD